MATRPPDPIHTVHGTIIRETEKALLVAVTAIGTGKLEEAKNHWFPFSQVTKIFHAPEDKLEADYLLVKEWILKEKGLLDLVAVEQKEPKTSSAPPWEDDIPF